MTDHAFLFIGHKAWRMSEDLAPTFTSGDLIARIIWRPVAVCAWEITVGEWGMCSLPIYKRADEAKADAYEALMTLRQFNSEEEEES
jgi:hypothetical protein